MTSPGFDLAGLPIPKQVPAPRRVSLPGAIRDAIEDWHHTRFTRAIVTGNDTNQVNVRRVGFAAADSQSYPKLDSVSVVADDEVLMLDLTGSGGWIIIGKIVRN